VLSKGCKHHKTHLNEQKLPNADKMQNWYSPTRVWTCTSAY